MYLKGRIGANVKMSTILGHMDNGDMALPQFRRGYVWNRDQVRGLFDSLYRRLPATVLLPEPHSDWPIHPGVDLVRGCPRLHYASGKARGRMGPWGRGR